MKRILKWLGAGVGVVAVAVAAFLAWVAIDGIPQYDVEKVDFEAVPTPARLERGKNLATLMCAACHMDPTTQQLTGKQMIDLPPAFGAAFSRNITRHPTKGIGGWTDAELAYGLRTGVARDGRYLPPWMPKLVHMSDEDLKSIVAFLRSDDPLVAPSDADPPGVSQPSFLLKVLCHVKFRKMPWPSEPIVAPAVQEKVAYGKYLAHALECFACHSESFKTANLVEPEKTKGYFGGGNELVNLRGKPIWSANLTFDEETGIGRWSEADFVRALREGFRPDGSLLRFPMAPMRQLSEAEAAAVFAYLKTVPKLRHAVKRELETSELEVVASRGKTLYFKYGCVGCHAENGVGMADLRQAALHYPQPQQLEAWIRNAPSIKPDTRMPRWDGVIAEGEYGPLIAYVLELGEGAAMTAYLSAERALWQHYGQTPRERTLDLKALSLKVRVLEVGEGPPVLFVHGGPSAGSTWAPLAARLSGFRCLVLDRPGCGLSEACDYDSRPYEQLAIDVLKATLDALDLPRVDIVASSMGGLWTLWLGRAAPERVGRVVQMGCPAGIDGVVPPAFLKVLSLPGLGGIVSRLLKPDAEKIRGIYSDMGQEVARIPAAYFEWAARLMTETPTMVHEREMVSKAVSVFGMRKAARFTDEQLAHVPQPTLFVWAEGDPFGGAALGQRMVSRMPSAEVVAVPGRGHLPWLDEPELCVEAAARFLSVRAPSTSRTAAAPTPA